MFGLFNDNKDSTEKVSKKKQEKKMKHVGRIKPHRGHTLFEVNKDTLEVNEANFIEETANYVDGATQTKAKRVLVKDGHFYISALNLKNCKKKIIKMLGITAGQLEELERQVQENKNKQQ